MKRPFRSGEEALQLVLLRHGIAVDRAHPDCPPDPGRWLTARGQRRSAKAVAGLAHWTQGAPGRVLSSPWRRAIETALIARKHWGARLPQIEEVEALLPGADPVLLAGVIARRPVALTLAVGHNPQMEKFLAFALGHRGNGRLQLKKAGAACLEWVSPEAGAPATLKWLATPKGLRYTSGG